MKRTKPKKKGVLGLGLIGTLTTPTAVLAAHALVEEPTILGEWLHPTEDHREPRHGMGGIPQGAQGVQAVQGPQGPQGVTGTSATTVGFTIDYPTPLAEYLLVKKSVNTMEHHHRTARDRAVRIIEQALQK